MKYSSLLLMTMKDNTYYGIIDIDGVIGNKNRIIALCYNEDVANEIISRLSDYSNYASHGIDCDEFRVQSGIIIAG